MKQPTKKINLNTSLKKVSKKKGINKQPVPKLVKFLHFKDNNISKSGEELLNSQKVSTSKLEILFKENFLDKIPNIQYIYQWEHSSGFVYDFAVLSDSGVRIDFLIEIDGDYWHANPRKYPNGPIYENQKRQKIRDESKNRVAAEFGLVLLRFWEYDIYNNPKEVMKILRERMVVS